MQRQLLTIVNNYESSNVVTDTFERRIGYNSGPRPFCVRSPLECPSSCREPLEMILRFFEGDFMYREIVTTDDDWTQFTVGRYLEFLRSTVVGERVC